MGELRQTFNQVLSQLAESREARYYLAQFSRTDRMHFAVVKVGGGVVEKQLESLAAALAFLRNLGLMPIILHGAGPQLDTALEAAGIPIVTHEGLRVTTPEAMAIVRPVTYRANRQIVTALEVQGVRAQGIQHGVFECDYLDQQKLGLVGEMRRVDLEAIRDAVERGVLPVVASLAWIHRARYQTGSTRTGAHGNHHSQPACDFMGRRRERSAELYCVSGGGYLHERQCQLSDAPQRPAE